MLFFTPAKAIIPGNLILSEIQERISRGLNGLGFTVEAKLSSEVFKVQTKGHPLLSLFDDWVPVIRFEGFYFATLEQDIENNRLIFSIQNFNFRKTEEELERYLPALEIFEPSEASMSEWFEASILPRELKSHPSTFRKLRGWSSLLI